MNCALNVLSWLNLQPISIEADYWSTTLLEQHVLATSHLFFSLFVFCTVCRARNRIMCLAITKLTEPSVLWLLSIYDLKDSLMGWPKTDNIRCVTIFLYCFWDNLYFSYRYLYSFCSIPENPVTNFHNFTQIMT